MIHMKCQVLFSVKNNKDVLESCVVQICLALSGLNPIFTVFLNETYLQLGYITR